MLKKYFPKITLLIFSLVFGILCSAKIIPNSINSVTVSSGTGENKKRQLENTYQLNFNLNTKTNGNINTYLIDRKPTSLAQADSFKTLFGFAGEMFENEECYHISNDFGTLKVLKNVNIVKYFKNNDDLLVEELDKDDIIKISLEFLEKNNLMFDYEEALVNSDGDFYSINFISRLNNLNNFSFPNKMILDKCGNIAYIEMNFIEYKRFNSVKTFSPKGAFLKLPVYYEKDSKIELNGAELVYYYEDSIIQPAYRFYGLFEKERSFECFIKAADYN